MQALTVGGSWYGCCCGSWLHVEVGCITHNLEILLKVGDCKDHRNVFLHLNIVLVSFEMSTNCYEQWMEIGGLPKVLCCSVGFWRWYTTSELINFMGFVHRMCWHLTHCVPGIGSVPENCDRSSPRNVVCDISVSFIHSFSILSDDRSKASSKTIPPHSAI